jgi:hypothetical protein
LENNFWKPKFGFLGQAKEREEAKRIRSEQLQEALEAATKSAAERAVAASAEAARNKAILEEEVRFWKIEALRAATEHDRCVGCQNFSYLLLTFIHEY